MKTILKWNDAVVSPPRPCDPVLGYSPHWVDQDFNRSGIRECFLTDDGPWHSARWDNDQDCWRVDTRTQPLLWLDAAAVSPIPLKRVLDERDGLRASLQFVYDLAPDLVKEGMENFGGYFCHWNQVIHFAAAHGVSGYAQDPMELLQRIAEQRDEAREELDKARKATRSFPGVD